MPSRDLDRACGARARAPARPGGGGRGDALGPPGARPPGGGISHEGNPIDASLQRGGCFSSSRRGNRSQNRHEVGGGLHAPGWPPAETILHDCFQALR